MYWFLGKWLLSGYKRTIIPLQRNAFILDIQGFLSFFFSWVWLKMNGSCLYNSLNSYPSSFRKLMARGRAYCRLPLSQDLRESWKVIMEPLRA